MVGPVCDKLCEICLASYIRETERFLKQQEPEAKYHHIRGISDVKIDNPHHNILMENAKCIGVEMV